MSLVLYGGERKWNAPRELRQLIDGNLPGMECYSNQFNYHLASVHDCEELDPAQWNVADGWFRALRVRGYPSASETASECPSWHAIQQGLR